MNKITFINNFHFKEEMAVSKLASIYGLSDQDNLIYIGHDYFWNNKYRNLQRDGLTVQEEDRFIRIKYKFSKIFPAIQIISNKDNHMCNRVYIPFSENELGTYFYIQDEKVFEILELSQNIISELEARAASMNKQIIENENYKPQLEKDINDLKFNVTFEQTLITTAIDFLIKTKKEIKHKDYYIPLTNYKSDLKKICEELNKFYKEEE